ncbi:MAG: HAMP domain-containing protein, partial [Gemmatimonadaceae bacterium]
MKTTALALGGGSLRRRLPLVIAALLLVGVSSFAAFAYRTSSRSLKRTAYARLATLAQEFAPPMGVQIVARRQVLAKVAAAPVLLAQLRAGATRPLAAATALMKTIARDTAGVLAVELRDSTGHTIRTLAHGLPVPGTDVASHAAGRLDTAAVSRLYPRNGGLAFELRANVVADGHVVGQLAEVRTAETSNGAAMKTVSQLIGSDGTLLLGNADGTVWTDLHQTVARPAPGPGLAAYTRDGRPRLGASAAVPNTPLVLAFEFDATRVTAPLHALLQEFAGLAAVIVFIGAVLGWWLSRGVTNPLASLTSAAEAISAGDLDHTPPASERGDEIGRLSRAFTRMTDAVRDARDHLEDQIARRTTELRDAQAELVKQERLATLGQLSSSVGHELRNPLGVMANAVYFLDATIASPHPKTTEYLGILRQQIALSEKIVSDLLDFARVKQPQREVVAIRALIGDQLQRVTLPDSVHLDRDGVSTCEVLVDPVQIGQVLLNLLTNAVQA